MPTNPYRHPYTEAQHARVESARKRLLARWQTDARFKHGQPSGFKVLFEETQVGEGGALFDVFLASPASSSFSEQWRREIDANAPRMTVEHGSRRFRVVVAHTYYRSALGALLPSLDGRCAVSSSVQLGVAALLAYTAYALSG